MCNAIILLHQYLDFWCSFILPRVAGCFATFLILAGKVLVSISLCEFHSQIWCPGKLVYPCSDTLS